MDLDAYRRTIAGLPDDKVIGSILWFTIHRPRLTIDEMRQSFIRLDLDERWLPNKINPVDAYRKATGEAKVEYPLAGDRQSAKLVFEESGYDDEMVERHLIRMHRDRKNKTVTHSKVGEAIFYKPSKNGGSERLRFSLQRPLLESDDEAAHAQKFLDETYSEYQLLTQFPTAEAMRGTIRRYVQSLNAIPVRPSGGVYFVHKSRQETVDSLQEFVATLNNASTIHTLPLIDTGEQREMLAEAFQEEVKKHCDLLLGEVAELNAKHKGKIPPAKYAKAHSSYTDLAERAREYTDILQLGMGSAAVALETALDAVSSMAERIDVK